jgi:malate dehydrogenase (oxaloacetate-decarboxylating)
MDIYKESVALHKKLQGKISLAPKKHIKTRHDLSLLYTPGVGQVSREIAKNPEKTWQLNSRRNWVAVVSDGSAVLGLGNIGPHAALPVMEGKAVLFKEFANVDAFPICLDTQDPEKIIETVKLIAPSFGGINLEDIAAPACFNIEERLIRELDIPVMHDDQHGTAVVVLAALINAAKISGRVFSKMRVVMSGAGAAGTAIAKILYSQGIREIVMCDSKGIIVRKRDDLNAEKKKLLSFTNPRNITGSLDEAFKDYDVFIGVSVAGLVTQKMVQSMANDPIIVAMANPVPEIMPDEARAAGARLIATGRSDFPNQVNNVLAFPGIFRGAFDAHAEKITEKMKLAAAHALASYVKKPTAERFVADPLDKKVAKAVARAVAKAA